MTPGIVLALLVACATLIWILMPLFRPGAAESERVGAMVSEVRDLTSRREMLLASLKDLEDDRATDKIDEADFRKSHRQLSAEAIEIMKQLDALSEARHRAKPVGLPEPPSAAADSH